MKKIFILFLAFIANFTLLNAADLTGVKIYINPGHGGYDGANDRNVETIPYALGDTLGFWESWSNLRKGLALRDKLQSSGATVYMSRTQNRDEDDRLLSEIAEEANANGVDAFLSIHSNALGTNTGTNYLLFLFHGYDADPTVPESKIQATAAWTDIIDNQLTNWTNYTTSTNIRGDFSFYGNTSGLGVLRPLTVPGFLSEGSFHDYKPETHRLLNDDYRKLEANRLLGVELEIKSMDFNTCLEAVTGGTVDLGISGFSYADDRAEAALLAGPYCMTSLDHQGCLLVKKDADIKTLEDLKGKKIAAQSGSLQHEYMTKYAPDSEQQTITSLADGVMMVNEGKIDALCISEVTGTQYAKNYDNLMLAELRFATEDGYYVLVGKDEQELYDAVQPLIEKAEADGLYEEWLAAATEKADSLGIAMD